MLIALVVVGFGVIIGRLIQLQVVQGEDLQKRAVDQQLKDTTISAQRGTIFDCNMKPLAQSATVWTVVLEPAYLKEEETKATVAEGLAKILDLDEKVLREKCDARSYYMVIKRKIESDVKDEIIKFKEDNDIGSGIRLIEDYKRYYPYGSFAASVLGFTGTDSQGLSGLEVFYDEYLTGTNGRLVTAKNAVGTDMPFDYEQMIPAQNGYSLVLSIDETIQHFLEKNLEEGIKNNLVENRATAIMVNVNTGAILGMAVKGDYDPNDPFTIADKEVRSRVNSLSGDEKDKAYNEALQQQWRNKAVSDTYYPGSVFKMITASMGIEEGVVNEESPFDCNGSVQPYEGARPIHCHKRTGHGHQTFLQALCNSCNPAFVNLGKRIGAEKFYEYYSGFGLSQKTGIDLPGEAEDIFFSADGSMGPVDLAVASFGQNFSITPIQMITAICAVANGGKLVQPHVVEKIIDDDGNIVKSAGDTVKRQVISEDTSRRICEMLHINATTGSGKNGYIPGYRIAGKTGTSEKIADQVATGEKNYIASYGGFAPADNPQVALLVFFDTPKGDSYYGSAVAAPAFANVMRDVLPYLGVEAQYTEEELAKLDTVTPTTIGDTESAAINKLQNAGLKYKVYGSGEKVVSQIPEPGKSIPKEGTVVLFTDSSSAEKTKTTVPVLTGLTLSEVNRVAAANNINISITGAASGSSVISKTQSIPEGTEVTPGTVVEVNFIEKDTVQ